MIITVCPDEVSKALAEEFGTSPTRISAIGGYSGTEKTMVYFVLNRFQIAKMKDIVHEADATAYITISEVADVFKSNIK
jgi:uncharacterized membrane-anchored protein YitT (DUF2179 family)